MGCWHHWPMPIWGAADQPSACTMVAQLSAFFTAALCCLLARVYGPLHGCSVTVAAFSPFYYITSCLCLTNSQVLSWHSALDTDLSPTCGGEQCPSKGHFPSTWRSGGREGPFVFRLHATTVPQDSGAPQFLASVLLLNLECY